MTHHRDHSAKRLRRCRTAHERHRAMAAAKRANRYTTIRHKGH